METTIYFPCPACEQTTLVEEQAGIYQCAHCRFSYSDMAHTDRTAFESTLAVSMQRDIQGILMAAALHAALTPLSRAELIKDFKNIAQRHNISLPI